MLCPVAPVAAVAPVTEYEQALHKISGRKVAQSIGLQLFHILMYGLNIECSLGKDIEDVKDIDDNNENATEHENEERYSTTG